jgi:FtsP/CotA-like multicopper oxidase with cupredoxin domain
MRGLVLGIHVNPAPGYVEPPRIGVRQMRLLVQTQQARLTGGQQAVGFVLQNGDSIPKRDSVALPGPVLDLERGKPVRITIVNNLPEPTGVHWHGLEIESFPDGVPGWSGTPGRISPPIEPGDSLAVEFTPPRAGTFLYHSHLHELAQISAGMYGTIIVRDGPRDPLRDHIVIAGGGGPAVFFKSQSPYALVNGRTSPAPLRMVAGETNRLRLVSIHPAWIVSFRLGNDSTVARWRAVAKDGADLPPALATERLARTDMGPGETADFEFTPLQPGRWVLEVASYPRGWRIQVPIIAYLPVLDR